MFGLWLTRDEGTQKVVVGAHKATKQTLDIRALALCD